METFNIIGIDPGLNMGVSVYNISLPDYNVNYNMEILIIITICTLGVILYII